MAESDEQFLSKYEPDKDEAFLAQYAPDQDEKFLEGFGKPEGKGLLDKTLEILNTPFFKKETDAELRRIQRAPGIIAEETARVLAEKRIPGASALGVAAATPAYLQDIIAPVPRTVGDVAINAAFLGIPLLRAAKGKISELGKMLGASEKKVAAAEAAEALGPVERLRKKATDAIQESRNRAQAAKDAFFYKRDISALGAGKDAAAASSAKAAVKAAADNLTPEGASEAVRLDAIQTAKKGIGEPQISTSKPSESAAFPGAAAHTDRISPERLEAAKAYINPSRFINEPAQDIIVAMAEDPATQRALLAQKRGVIPLEASRKAGKALGATPEDFMALKPGQALPKGTPDAQVSAAVLVQRAMADDLAESAALHAKGIPVEELSDRVVRAYDSIIGAQGIISETGRGLSAARLTPKEKAMKLLARNLLKDEVMENPEKLSAFLKMIADLPKDQIAQRIIAAKRLIPVERSVVGMLLEARGAALLTNPLTYLRNTAGNSLAAMTRHAELASTGGLDFLYSTLTGKPQTRYAMEAKAMLSGEWQAIGRAAKDGLAVLLDETVARGFAAEQVLAGGQIPGTVGKVVRLPFRILNATDTFFRTILANGEMGRLAYLDAVKNGLTGTARAERIQQLMAAPSEEMLTSALSVAREYTFQKPLDGIAALGAKALATPGAGPFLRFIVPFYKTPVNIAKFIVERTPVLSELTKSGVLRSTILSSNQTKEQILEAVSKNLMGLGAMTSAAVALKWKEGIITGAAPKDRVERENLEATGWKPYHIKLGGLYLNYRGIEPLASFLAGVADFAKFGEDNTEANQDEKALKLMGSAVKNFFNQPFLQGLKDVFDFIENPEGFQGRARFAQLAASVVPSGVGVIARATNPIRRNPEGILEAMAARTPILQDRVRPKLTRWGEPIVNTSWFFGLLDEPLPASDPVEAKLRDLGLTKVIGFPSDRVGHGKGAVKMNKDEYNELLQLRGKAMRETVQKLLKHPQFSVIQKHQQRALLERNEHQITDAAMDQMRGKVALRAHGINDQLLPDEMMALGSRLQMPDFWDMERSKQKTVLFDFVKRIKALR